MQVDLQVLHVRHSLHPADFAVHTLRPAPFQSESVSLQMSGLLHALRPEAAHAGSYQGEDGNELGGVNGSLQVAVTFFFFFFYASLLCLYSRHTGHLRPSTVPRTSALIFRSAASPSTP